MALFNIIIKDDEETKELLRRINCKLDKLLSGSDAAVIVKATQDLKSSSTELKKTVEKNKPS